MPKAGSGGSVLARGEEVAAFIARREAVGRESRKRGVVVWDAAWPGYGGRGQRRAGSRRLMAARGRRCVTGVQAARGTVQGAHTRHT
jgi:hypothetical protein